MSSRIKTLILHAYGAGWKTTVIDSALEGLMRLDPAAPAPRGPLARWAVRRYWSGRYGALSYVNDWLDALVASPDLDATLCNIHNVRAYSAALGAIRNFELVVVMHSAFGDDISMLNRGASRLERRRGPLALFVGNEYSLMAEKISFARRIGAEFICSQLPAGAATWLYAECERATILPLPHALNPSVYTPGPDRARPVDIGFIGAAYGPFLGDSERDDLIRALGAGGERYGLHCDIRFRNVPRADWAAFLQSCRGTVGGESGTYFLERDGRAIESAKAYVRRHPAATAADVFDRFYRPLAGRVSGKAISSRHFEPIGTRTCQVLVAGDYNGVLRAGEHYIAVSKDQSDLDEAVRQFKDPNHRAAVVDRAYAHVLGHHTYAHRVAEFVRHVAAGRRPSA